MNDAQTSRLVAGEVARPEPFGRDDAKVTGLKALSDDELLRRLAALLGQSRHIEWELIAHIGEVDERRLYAREACDSMFVYCTDVLHLSEHEAYLRITAARAAREHPMLLAMLADGRLHLSGIAKLARHLTPASRDVLLQRATHRSKRQIEILVAELAPRPDVPPSIRRLPKRGGATRSAAPAATPLPSGGDDGCPGRADTASCGDGEISVRVEPTPKDDRELGPDRVRDSLASDARLGQGRVGTVLTPTPEQHHGRIAAGVATPSPSRSAVEPLAPGRYKVQFTASAAFCEKLERLKVLMRSSVPDGDLARVLETAVTEALERREARRFGKSKSPRKTLGATDTSASSSRYVPAAVRRASHEKDDGRCGFVGRDGRLCGSYRRLEFHHVVPWARGGDRSPANIRLMCKIHNAYLAEKDYGQAVMARFRRTRRRPSAGTDGHLSGLPSGASTDQSRSGDPMVAAVAAASSAPAPR